MIFSFRLDDEETLGQESRRMTLSSVKVNDAVDRNITEAFICKIPSLNNAAGDQVLVCMQFIAVLDLYSVFFFPSTLPRSISYEHTLKYCTVYTVNWCMVHAGFKYAQQWIQRVSEILTGLRKTWPVTCMYLYIKLIGQVWQVNGEQVAAQFAAQYW